MNIISLMIALLLLVSAGHSHAVFRLQADHQHTSGGVAYQVQANPINWLAELQYADYPINHFYMDVNLSGVHQLSPAAIKMPQGLYLTHNANGIRFSATDFNPFVYQKDIVAIGNIDFTNMNGDGIHPLVTQDRSRFFLTFHHSDSTQNALYCHDIELNQVCSGYPRPIPMGDQSSHVSTLGLAIIDEHDRLYFNAHNDHEYGISCWEAMHDSDCGYVKLGEYEWPASGELPSPLAGPQKVDDAIYTMDEKGTIHCLKEDLSLCDGVYPKIMGQYFSSYENVQILSEVINHQIFFLTQGQGKLTCWDTKKQGICDGWSVLPIDLGISQTTEKVWHSLFFTYDQQAQADRICAHSSAFWTHAVCVRIDNAYLITPSHVLPELLSPFGFGYEVTFKNAQNEAVTVFPPFFGDTILVHNWTSGEQKTYTHPALFYGASIDSAGCIWFGGHQLDRALEARIDSHQETLADSLLQGCPIPTAAQTITPTENYCQHDAASQMQWDRLQVINVVAHDYHDLTLEIYGENGQLLSQHDVLNALNDQIYQLDLNLPIYQDQQTLSYQIRGTPVQEATTHTAKIQLYFSRPSPQVCFATQGTQASCDLNQAMDLQVITSADGAMQTQAHNGIFSVHNSCDDLDNFDYGDAPDSYGTLDASNGAKHTLSADIYLGHVQADADPNGSPSITANGDDQEGIDDDDGIILNTPLQTGHMAILEVTGYTADNINGYLHCWADWDHSGNFNHGEQIIKNYHVTGQHIILVDVPADASVGDTFVRCRLANQTDIEAVGFGGTGEVEDYLFSVNAAPSQYTFLPSDSAWYTAAFEDAWPAEGDFDMNDVVVQYQVKLHHDPQQADQITRLDITGRLHAYGAYYHNGFAIHFPGLTSDLVNHQLSAYYRNGEVSADMIDQAPELIVIGSHDLRSEYLTNAGCVFHRTEMGCYGEDVQFTFHAKITFKAGVNLAHFIPAAGATGGYDPFIFSAGGWRDNDAGSNTVRVFEIHTADYPPTSVGYAYSSSLFSMLADTSDPDQGRFYRTENNIPWGFVIADHWIPPAEYQDVSETYTGFSSFVSSGGEEETDWYMTDKAAEGLYQKDE